jgi:hypothetical protein
MPQRSCLQNVAREKGRAITYGDRARVLSELRRVTCGRLVHKPVDNRHNVRITAGTLWATCGRGKKLKLIPAVACGNLAEGVEMLSPPETGTIWGTPRNARMAGKPEVRAGTWPWWAARGAGNAGRLADAGKPADADERALPGIGGCQVTGGCWRAGDVGGLADTGQPVEAGKTDTSGAARPARPPSSHT